MPDQFSTTTSRNYFQRLGDSFVGILVGLALLLIGPTLLFWNEGRAVDASRGLSAAAKEAVTVTNAVVLPANERKLVHVTGAAEAPSPLVDDTLTVSIPNALAMERKVQMFQWVETTETKTTEKVGGTQETTTTTTYIKKWQEGPVDSSSFKRPEGHTNPAMPLQSSRSFARDAKLGDFVLSEQVINLLSAETPFTPTITPAGWTKTPNGMFKGIGTMDAPNVGDLQVIYSFTAAGTMSVMGAQIGNQLTAWPSGKGRFEVLLASPTIKTKEAMVSDAKDAEGFFTWVLRLVGTLVCIAGFGLIMGPIKALGNVIPFVANVVGAATGLVALGLGSILALIVIALAWFVVRPILSIALLMSAIGVTIGLSRLRPAIRAKAPA